MANKEITQNTIKEKFLSYLSEQINDMISDYSSIDGFAEEHNLSEEEINYIQSLNVKVIED